MFKGKNNPNWRGGKVKIICQYCKLHFFRDKCQEKQKCCSKKCMAQSYKKPYPKCLDCDNIVKDRRAIRCRKCSTKGKLNQMWNGGISTENQNLRNSEDYKNWRNTVYKRDNYTCALCNKRGRNLNAHHIRKFSKFKNLRLIINNGITLCKKCHKNYVTWNEQEYEDYFDILILSKELI